MGGMGGIGGMRWPCSRTNLPTNSTSSPGSPSGNHLPSRVGRNMDHEPDSFRQSRSTGNSPAARMGITVRQFLRRRTHSCRIFIAQSVFRTTDSSSTDNFMVFIRFAGLIAGYLWGGLNIRISFVTCRMVNHCFCELHFPVDGCHKVDRAP
jgi:hypothetical protein